MRDRFLQMLVPAIVVLALVVAVRHVYAQAKAPVPAAESQEPARKAATEIYGGRFQQAKTAAEKTALATEMIEAATKVQDGSPDQYVLLKIAADNRQIHGQRLAFKRQSTHAMPQLRTPGALQPNVRSR